MLQKKYASPQFRWLQTGVLISLTKALLIKIHVITGWPIPEDADILVVLTDQFRQLLLEEYGDMNAEEVEYAFRRGGTSGEIKDWGKSLNLALIEQVLVPYRNKRYDLGRIEERAKVKPEPSRYARWDIELDYAFLLLKMIDKLPCRVIRRMKA